jgi:SAM-dependent methyltransferase
MKWYICLLLMLIFSCLSIRYADTMPIDTLRVPIEDNVRVETGIMSGAGDDYKKIQGLLIEGYLMIEGTSNSRQNSTQKDNLVVDEIKQYGESGVNTVVYILNNDERAWVRAKAVYLLAKLIEDKNMKNIINALIKRAGQDESMLVRSVIVRGVLNNIKKGLSFDEIDLINKINLNPWPENRSILRVLDVGCQYGETTNGMAEYFSMNNRRVFVVGVDYCIPVIIEAEKNKKRPDVVFILGDITKDKIGPADLVIAMNMAFDSYLESEKNFAEGLTNQISSEGEIWYLPSTWGVDDLGLEERLYSMMERLKQFLSGATIEKKHIELYFDSQWGKAYSDWVIATTNNRTSI